MFPSQNNVLCNKKSISCMHGRHGTYQKCTVPIPTYTYEKCVGDTIPRHDFVGEKIGQLKRMLPTCRADIVNMSATDTNVCRLGGVADRHKSRLYQPSDSIVYFFGCIRNSFSCIHIALVRLLCLSMEKKDKTLFV